MYCWAVPNMSAVHPEGQRTAIQELDCHSQEVARNIQIPLEQLHLFYLFVSLDLYNAIS